jgi:hypothetical protein
MNMSPAAMSKSIMTPLAFVPRSWPNTIGPTLPPMPVETA